MVALKPVSKAETMRSAIRSRNAVVALKLEQLAIWMPRAMQSRNAVVALKRGFQFTPRICRKRSRNAVVALKLQNSNTMDFGPFGKQERRGGIETWQTRSSKAT